MRREGLNQPEEIISTAGGRITEASDIYGAM